MLGRVFREEKSGIVAQESSFGWVLSGSSGVTINGGVNLLNMRFVPDNVVRKLLGSGIYWSKGQ